MQKLQEKIAKLNAILDSLSPETRIAVLLQALHNRNSEWEDEQATSAAQALEQVQVDSMQQNDPLPLDLKNRPIELDPTKTLIRVPGIFGTKVIDYVTGGKLSWD